MPFPVDVDATWLNLTASYDGGELRRADAALVAGASGQGFGGVARHSDTSLAVTVDGSDVVTVQPGSVVIPGDAATGVGIYRAGLSAAQTGNLTARNATNPRIDLLVFRAMDTSVVGAHAAYRGRVELIAGTPAAVPAVPTKPSMAVELARITVPQTGGGAATVDSTWRTYSCAAGAELVVPTAARLPASGLSKFQRARALDTGTEYYWSGTAWRRKSVAGSVFVAAPAASVAISFPAGAFAAAPIVTATCTTGSVGAAVVAAIGNVTATGCTAFLYAAGGASWTSGAISVYYEAVEAH